MYDVLRLAPDLTEAVVAGDCLLHAGLVDPDTISAYEMAQPRRRGVRQLRAALPLLNKLAASPPESRLRLLCQSAGLPPHPSFRRDGPSTAALPEPPRHPPPSTVGRVLSASTFRRPASYTRWHTSYTRTVASVARGSADWDPSALRVGLRSVGCHGPAWGWKVHIIAARKAPPQTSRAVRRSPHPQVRRVGSSSCARSRRSPVLRSVQCA
jgi:hypothetical protein